jgi:glycosyltransferase involved in cell wall biosynthesis
VDFHTWDGIFQGSRSHVLGLYRQAIVQAPDLDFVFFLGDTESLRAAHAEFAAPNVKLVTMPHGRAVWRLAVQLPWLRWRHGIDLLHMQYRLPLPPLGACAVTIHDVLFETYPQFFPQTFVWQSKLTFRHAARHADVLFSVSEFSKQDIARHYGVPAERIRVTYNGVDAQRFHPAGPGEPHDATCLAALGLASRGYLLTVGRLEPRKNHETLIRAYAQLPPDAPPLVIVGQRDFTFDRIFTTIDELGLRSRIKLLDKVGDDTLPMLMRHARLFAYPAFAEGFGMPVAEALASGVPVITSYTTSLPEVAGDAALYTHDPHDATELAQLMRRVLGDDTLAQAMAAKGLERARAFDWAASARVLVAAFRQHLQARGRL